MPSKSVRSSARGNSGRPESHRKALNPTTPRCGQFRQLVAIARNQAAPQSEIGDRALLESAARFRRTPRRIHGARRGVQGHVEEQRAAAGSERAAARGGALPFGAAGLVEMQVRIDQARERWSGPRHRFPRGQPASSGPMAAMRPSSMAISALATPPGDDRAAANHQLMHERAPARPAMRRPRRARLRRRPRDGFVGMVADAAGRAQEQHRRGHRARPRSWRRARRRWSSGGPGIRLRDRARQRVRQAGSRR